MIVSLGTPMAIQSGCINLSMLFVNTLVNEVGVVASAAFGVGVRIDDIFNKLSQGLHYAAMPMISQNIAAKKEKRAIQIVWWTWLFSGVFTLLTIAIYLLFGHALFQMFSDDVAVHAMASDFIAAILWMFPALALMRGTGAFIQGIGNVRFGMVLSLLDGVILRVGLSYLLGIVLDMGFYGFVLGYGLAAFGYAVPSTVYFLCGIWKKRQTLADKL